MKGKKIKKLLLSLAILVLACSFVTAATTGTLELAGTVNTSLSVAVVTESGATFSFDGGVEVSQTLVATVTLESNITYDFNLKSLYNGFLDESSGTGTIDYVFEWKLSGGSYAPVTFNGADTYLASPLVDNADATLDTPDVYLFAITVPAGSTTAGTAAGAYVDTVTFEITTD